MAPAGKHYKSFGVNTLQGTAGSTAKAATICAHMMTLHTQAHNQPCTL